MLCFNSFVFVQKFEESAGVWVALQRLLLHGDSGLRGRGTHRVVGIIQEKVGKNTHFFRTSPSTSDPTPDVFGLL